MGSRIIDVVAGDLLRELALDPNGRYQPAAQKV